MTPDKIPTRNHVARTGLLSGTAVYLISNILNAAIPFALLPVLTRYLSPAEYGEVAMFQTLISVLGAFVGISVVGAANRKYFDDPFADRESRDFMAACLQILAGSSAAVFAVIFTFQTQFAGWLDLHAKWILWAVFVSAASVVVSLRLGQWQVRKEAWAYGMLQISQSACNMLLSLLLVVVLLQGAEGRIAAQVWTSALFGLISLALLNRGGLFRFLVWRPGHLKEVLKFALPLTPHILGTFLLASVDRFVINAELGIAEVGIYMVAAQLAAGFSIVFDAINKAYVPWLFERLERNLPHERHQIVRYTYMWFLTILLGAATVFVAAPWLVTSIAGPDYARAGEVIGWLALGQGFGGMYLMVTNYVFYSKRTGMLSLATIASGLVNVALLVALVRRFGLEGAAIAFSIAMALRFFLTWWVAQKRHPMPWFNLKPAN